MLNSDAADCFSLIFTLLIIDFTSYSDLAKEFVSSSFDQGNTYNPELLIIYQKHSKETTLENVEPVHEVIGVCGHRSLTCYKLGQRIQVFL